MPNAPAGRRGTDAVIACGALSAPAAEIVERRGWPVDVHPLPPLLHNRPERIAARVEETARALAPRYRRIAVGYADCGTYGAVDEVCERLGLVRLRGLHCYDVYAGPVRLQEIFAQQPGTYVLTDFLARSFARTVVSELGLDRHPDLRDDYFGHYTRVVWIAQDPDAMTAELARQAADRIGLPLTRIDVGTGGLEKELERLVG